jgi:hypothetical protein
MSLTSLTSKVATMEKLLEGLGNDGLCSCVPLEYGIVWPGAEYPEPQHPCVCPKCERPFRVIMTVMYDD